MKKILINASNLHVGGGVQVAASFISELFRSCNLKGFKIVASTAVNKNLTFFSDEAKRMFDYEVVDFYSLDFFSLKKRCLFSGFDVIFTIFGPFYHISFSKFLSVVGFAQAWIIYPENDFYRQMNCLDKIKIKLKFFIQKLFFSRADYLIVELDHVKEGLINSVGFPGEKIRVVKNTCSNIFNTPDCWREVYFPVQDEKELKLGFLGRNYPHKNIEIFSKVAFLLREKFGIKARLYVTFNEKEWAECSDDFKKVSCNVGSLSSFQCPDFYRKVDAVFFPSLLECFSVTPLEAMIMRKKVFASDRGFNRDVCGDYADYFDPLDPLNIAEVIANYIIGDGDKLNEIERAWVYAASFSSAQKRASEYVSILNSI